MANLTVHEFGYIIESVKTGNATRAQQMIAWILDNQDKINGYKSGNIQFSFTNGTLKVKDENYIEIK